MKNIETQEELEQVIQEENTLLLFSADWCPDCRIIEPILPAVEADFPEFTLYHVDRDKFIDTCAEWNVFGIPSFLVFNEGKEVNRFVSKDRKTQAEIEQFLTESLAKL